MRALQVKADCTTHYCIISVICYLTFLVQAVLLQWGGGGTVLASSVEIRSCNMGVRYFSSQSSSNNHPEADEVAEATGHGASQALLGVWALGSRLLPPRQILTCFCLSQSFAHPVSPFDQMSPKPASLSSASPSAARSELYIQSLPPTWCSSKLSQQITERQWSPKLGGSSAAVSGLEFCSSIATDKAALWAQAKWPAEVRSGTAQSLCT